MRFRSIQRTTRFMGLGAAIAVTTALACASTATGAAMEADPTVAVSGDAVSVIPQPVSIADLPRTPVRLTSASLIKVHPLDTAAARVGELVSDELAVATGFDLPVGQDATVDQADGTVQLSTRGPVELGDEGYRLTSGNGRVEIVAHTAEGLYRGATTLRQLLPPQIESPTVTSAQWQIPATQIDDHPRYAYRGAMLDVGRRFYPVADVKRFIDQMARYKLNILHLHLTDDQGWRLAVDARPSLTSIGASTQSGWAPGSGGPWFYTKADYAQIVRYAADRFVDVVPEIDGPGHTLAAQASIPEINCSGISPQPYSGFDVGLRPVCLNPERRAAVASYLRDVLTEASRQSSGSYVHIGGDEVPSTTDEQMDWYVRTAGDIVAKEGRRVVGWHQIGVGTLPANSVLQWWGTDGDRATIGTASEASAVRDIRSGLAQGAKVLVSPADRAYLDMRYDSTVPYGLKWAGTPNLRKAYEWSPVSALSRPDGTKPLVDESQVEGVEAALWADRAYRGSSALPTSHDQFVAPRTYADFMTFPRLPAIAEIGWTPETQRGYDGFVDRIVAHGKRWDAAGIGYYRAPDIAWAAATPASAAPESGSESATSIEGAK